MLKRVAADCVGLVVSTISRACSTLPVSKPCNGRADGMPINPEHLAFLRHCIEQERQAGIGAQGPVGLAPRDWARGVEYVDAPQHLSEVPLDRAAVRAFCADERNRTVDCALVVLAWGGTALRAPYRQLVWQARDRWVDTVERLRCETQTRTEAYQALRALKANRPPDNLPGLGPSFFTKLIYFMLRAQDGWIMDQWLSKSINLLAGEPIVRLLAGGAPSLENTHANYERFCRYLEEIAATLQLDPESTEQALFSRGGRHPRAWRAYVREHARIG